MANKNDAIFKQLALRGAELEGVFLLRQNAELNANGAVFVTPRLDERARAISARRKKRRRALVSLLAAAAACLVLLVALPPLLQQQNSAQNIMPLRFELPYEFSVADSKYDNGMSVYELKNSLNDDVVLTMEVGQLNGQDYADFDTVTVNSQTAYASANSGYQLLVFEKDGVVYTLSCQYDINTLIKLAEAIV